MVRPVTDQSREKRCARKNRTLILQAAVQYVFLAFLGGVIEHRGIARFVQRGLGAVQDLGIIVEFWNCLIAIASGVLLSCSTLESVSL